MARVPNPLLAILLGLAVASGGASTILASSVTLGRVDESVWQVAGNVFHYQVTLPGISGTYPFDVIVHEATGSVVRMDVLVVGTTQTFALQGSYDRLTRQDVRDANVTAPLWVRQADVDRGHARFAGKDLAYNASASSLQHVFEDAQSRYAFHRTEGYLMGVESRWSGGGILLVGKGVGAPVPASPRTTPSDAIVARGTPLGLGGALEEGPGPFSYPVTTLDITCPGPRTFPPPDYPAYAIDGRQTDKCPARFDVETTAGFAYDDVYTLEFPAFAIGQVETWYRDMVTERANGVARHYFCEPLHVISKPDEDITCRRTDTRGQEDPHEPGENWVESQGTWRFCLDPTNLWTCDYAWRVPATGRIACLDEHPKCVDRNETP